MVKHHIKECLSVTSSLHGLVHVEVKHAKWLYLFNSSSIASNEQISLSDFQKADDLLAMTPNIQPVVRVK